MDITQLLAFSVKNKASDLHLSAGLPPMIRVHGDVRRINVDALDHKQVHAMVYDIMNDTQRKNYEEFLHEISRLIPVLRVRWDDFWEVERLAEAITREYMRDSFLREVVQLA